MLCGTRGRPALKTTIATIALLGMSAGTAAAAPTGGAGLADPAPQRVSAKLPKAKRSSPRLAPVRTIPQLDAGVALRKVGRRAASAATLAYVSRAPGALRVRVDVVRLADGLSVFTDERSAEPGTLQRVRWNGRVSNGLAVDGKYELRIALASASSSSSDGNSVAGGASPTSAEPPPGSASVKTFTFVGAAFPVRGPHDYGESAARFGAGRGHGGHQGHDVMADCGTPLVAARGGRVIMRARHSRAGNYLVIHDAVTGESHMYAHLRGPAIVRRGQRVETGQPLGIVGDTGSASACHLHFEIWTSPGWYRGGSPIDPYPTLRRWIASAEASLRRSSGVRLLLAGGPCRGARRFRERVAESSSPAPPARSASSRVLGAGARPYSSAVRTAMTLPGHARLPPAVALASEWRSGWYRHGRRRRSGGWR